MASTEKIKEIIQSDEIRTFLEELLNNQSRELLKEFEQNNKEEVKKLENEKKEIEQKYAKLSSDNEQLRDVINDCKSREKELIEKQKDLTKQIENLKTTEETLKSLRASRFLWQAELCQSVLWVRLLSAIFRT